MLPDKPSGLGAELEYRKGSRIVDIKRCAIEILDTRHQLVPLHL